MAFNQIKETLTAFCKETLIHGFGYAGGSQKLWQIILYTIIVLTCVVMMIRDAFFLFDKYSTEPTKVDLTVMHNTTFSLGQPTVCFFPSTYEFKVSTSGSAYSAFDIDNFQFNEADDGGIAFSVPIQDTKDSLIATLSPYNYNFSRYAEYIKRLNETHVESVLTTTKALYAALYHLLSIVMTREHQLIMSDVAVQNWLEADEAESLRLFFIEKNVDFTQVRDFLGLLSCLKAQFSYSVTYSSKSIPKRPRVNESSNFCQTAKLSFAGITDITGFYDQFPKFCFQIPTPITLQKSLDFVTLNNVVPNQNPVDPYNCRISLDFEENDGYFSGHSQSSVINICNVQQTVKISIVSDINAYNSAKKPCRDHDELACLLRCQQETFLSNCKCFPLRLVLDVAKPLNMSDCCKLPLMNVTNVLDVGKYAEVLGQFCSANVTDVGRCESLCPVECSTRQLMFNYEDVTRVNTFDLSTKIFVSTFVYPQFDESPLYTWSDLLMAFGGSIGFWLGASIIAFAHVAIFFLSGLIAAAFRMGMRKEKDKGDLYNVPQSTLYPTGKEL